MTYHLTFDKKRGFLTLACLGMAGVLLIVAGFLVGASFHSVLSAAPPAKRVALPAALKSAKNSAKGNSPVAVPIPPLPPKAVTPGATTATDDSGDAKTGFTLQYGAFQDKSDAGTLVKRLKDEGINATIFSMTDPGGALQFAVRSGAYASSGEAAQAASNASQSGQVMPIVRPSKSL